MKTEKNGSCPITMMNQKRRGRKPYKSIVEETAKIVAEHFFDDMQVTDVSSPKYRGDRFNEKNI